jgi:hypothetical protein
MWLVSRTPICRIYPDAHAWRFGVYTGSLRLTWVRKRRTTEARATVNANVHTCFATLAEPSTRLSTRHAWRRAPQAQRGCVLGQIIMCNLCFWLRLEMDAEGELH